MSLETFLEKAKEGMFLKDLPLDTEIKVQTQNTEYTLILKSEGQVMIQGGKYFPEPTLIYYHGATLGGRAIKPFWLGPEMCMEVSIPDGKTITTSPVQSISYAKRHLRGTDQESTGQDSPDHDKERQADGTV